MTIAVLLVGPEVAGMPALQVTAELLRIGDLRGVDLVPLVGPDVTMARVLDRMDRQHYDVLLWSGHGTPSMLLLSDGAAMSPYGLAVQLAGHGIPLAVLSTCESAMRPEVATLSLGFQDVLPMKGVAVVAMAQNVLDRAAVEYDVALLQALEAGSNIRQSHQAGLEAAALAGNAAAPQLFVADSGDSANPRLSLKTERKQAVDHNYDELIKMIYEIRSDVQVLKEQVLNLRHYGRETAGIPPQMLAVLIGIGLLTLLILSFMTVRIGL